MGIFGNKGLLQPLGIDAGKCCRKLAHRKEKRWDFGDAAYFVGVEVVFPAIGGGSSLALESSLRAYGEAI